MTLIDKMKTLSSINKNVGLFIILSFAFLQYLRGYRIYVFFLLLFIFVQLVFKKRSFLLLTIFVFFVVFTRSLAFDTFLVLKEQSLEINAQPQKTLATILAPNSGEEVFPKEVLSMLYLLRQYNLSDYMLSNSIQRDPLLFQRIVEGAWPSQYQKESSYVFCRKDEMPIDIKCDVLDQKGDVYLVYCS